MVSLSSGQAVSSVSVDAPMARLLAKSVPAIVSATAPVAICLRLNFFMVLPLERLKRTAA